ncbi:hypothetical protein D3C74_289900 [compost metagenome]
MSFINQAANLCNILKSNNSSNHRIPDQNRNSLDFDIAWINCIIYTISQLDFRYLQGRHLIRCQKGSGIRNGFARRDHHINIEPVSDMQAYIGRQGLINLHYNIVIVQHQNS